MGRSLTLRAVCYAVAAAAYMFVATAALDTVWRINDDFIWARIPPLGLFTMTTYAIVLTPFSFVAA